MDYSKLLQYILDIAEEMLVAGAEVNRVEDSIERMLCAYGCPYDRVNAFIMTINIQVTFEDPDGNIITQIRSVKRNDTNFDRLDYLNDLSRYIAENSPDLEDLRARYIAVMERPKNSKVIKYLSGALIACAFSIFFGGSFFDGLCSAAVSFLVLFLMEYLSQFSINQLAVIFITSVLSGIASILICSLGFSNLDKVIIGEIMLMIPGIAMTNSLRDMLLGDIATGLIRLANALLLAGMIALGFAVPLAFMRGLADISVLTIPTPLIVIPMRSGAFANVIQIITAFIGCTGFAILFNMKKKQVAWSGLGGALAWAIYLYFTEILGGLFIPTLLASIFVGVYSEVMARVNKAPSTIFYTSVALAMIPGSSLYYAMEDLVYKDVEGAGISANKALTIALAISLGIVLVTIVNRILNDLKAKRRC